MLRLTKSSGSNIGGEEDGLGALAEVVVDGHTAKLMQGSVERQNGRRTSQASKQLADVLHLFAALDNQKATFLCR